MFARSCLLAAVCAALAAPAEAGYQFRLTPSATTVAAGAGFDLTASIAWDGAGTNGLVTQGLISAGVGLRGSVPGLIQPLDTTTGADGNPAFDFGPVLYNASSGPPFVGGANRIGGLSEATLFNDPVTTTGTTPIVIGVFHLVTTSPGTITITAGRLDQAGGTNWLTLNDGTNLDGIVTAATAQITITGQAVLPTPAPASAVLLLCAAVGLIGRRAVRRPRATA